MMSARIIPADNVNSLKKKLHKPGTPYHQLKAQIRPFDLILFRGSDFVSDSIRKLQKKQLGKGADTFSHAGVIVTTEVLSHPNMVPGKLYIFESTMSGKLGGGVKNINNETWLGSQIRDFDDVMETYDNHKKTAIAWLKLKSNPLDNQPLDVIREKMAYFFGKYNHILYEVNISNLFMALFPKLRFCRCGSQQKQLFCSEVVALLYKKFGVLPEECVPTNVVPADFIVKDEDKQVDCNLWENYKTMTVFP